MHIRKRNEYDNDFYSGSRWSEIECFSKLEYLEDIKNDLIAIKKLIDSNFKDLPDEEFIKLVSNFYLIYIGKKDILNIISKVNNIEYNKIQKLNSTMTFKDIVSEGHGRDFSWWEETFQVIYIVATSYDLTLKEHYYSKEEIKQMVKNKQIILFDSVPRTIGINSKLQFKFEEYEKRLGLLFDKAKEYEKIEMLNISLDIDSVDKLLEEFDTNFDFSILIKGTTPFSEEVYKNTVSLIRKRLNKKKVLNDCKEILLFLNENIDSINDVIKNEYFYDEKDEKKYLDLSKEVKQHQKSLLLNLTNYSE